MEGDRPAEPGGSPIPLLELESDFDLPLNSKRRAPSSPARYSCLGGDSGGEFDAELFRDLGPDAIDTGLRAAASVLWSGPVEPESRRRLVGGLTSNNASWSSTHRILQNREDTHNVHLHTSDLNC